VERVAAYTFPVFVHKPTGTGTINLVDGPQKFCTAVAIRKTASKRIRVFVNDVIVLQQCQLNKFVTTAYCGLCETT
jgi:3-methyladenine DNA glycosylase Mpg